MAFDVESVTQRLESLGYTVKEAELASLTFCVDKVTNTIKNDTNQSSVPEGLEQIAINMACGEFLLAKKTFAPADLATFDLGAAVKRIQTGDETTEFVTGDASMTDEQRLNNFINYLLNSGRDEFNTYRRLKW